MFDNLFSSDSNDAISFLKRDHDRLRDLFKQFENAEPYDRLKIASEAIEELKAHTVIEEEIFYPAVRAELKQEMMTEADEEHHVAKLLIGELEKMTGNEEHYGGKFTVLAENTEHHVDEEERELFPAAKKLDIDLDALGEKLMLRKDELLHRGVPIMSEEQAADPQSDSSARAAQKTVRAPKTRTA